MNWIFEPWPWYVAGPLIALIMLLLLLFGKSFGFSANLRTVCSIAGAGKAASFFKFDWKSQVWNLVFALGAILGGFIAHNYLSNGNPIDLNPATVENLQGYGFETPGDTFLPNELFGAEALSSWQGWVFLIIGGLLIGFGSRYAGGCTSGHAISGLSALQLPSLIAVIGFFIGGLIMTFLVLPQIL
ncbi:MAG: YeeE/YedE family protein [Flavobacteriales bacterium]